MLKHSEANVPYTTIPYTIIHYTLHHYTLHHYTLHHYTLYTIPYTTMPYTHTPCTVGEIQKEACWTLSNIAAGTADQIQCVLDSGSIPPLVNLASAAQTDPEVKSEACWVVLNATSCGSDEQVR
jgi:hypothetical protein